MKGSPAVALAWQIAAAEARNAAQAEIPPVLLLAGILSLEKVRRAEEAALSPAEAAAVLQERAALAEVVSSFRTSTGELRRACRHAAGRGVGAPSGPISRSAAAKAAFAAAATLANDGAFTTVHLLAALAERPDAAMVQALAACGVAAGELASRARAFAGVAKAPRADMAAREDVAGAGEAARAAAPDTGTPTLDRFGRDLTALARRGGLSPIIGRRAELLAVVQTLARSTKPNPLLVGEAGVGKTAIVEGLAVRAVQGKDAAVLGGRRIVELDVGALLGGTEYRGEFEKRLTCILDEVRARPEVLLFVDEVHTIVGAGRVGEGGPDAASLVKPALARGELRLIGATTPPEYRRALESEAALARRFEVIEVPEPDAAETLEILRGLRPRVEAHHGVRLEPAALEAAVALAERFLPERRLPDKAIDLVDRAAARACVPRLSMRAGEPGPAGAAAPLTVDAFLVAAALAERMGLPLELVLSAGPGETSRIASLESFLKTRLFGQDAAVEGVARRLRLAHSGLQQRRGPLAVLLFLGPTGVGKTELARLLAEQLFGSPSDLVRFDMSEYMEEHAVARLLGAPPGYVGHDEEGQLTRSLRGKPYSVVLLDEVEKAHPRIFDVFLQVFDDGRVTDAHGRAADARHAIFVLTSNLGAEVARARVGFRPGAAAARDDERSAAMAELRRFFRAELLNRIDEVLLFQPLDAAAAGRILRQRLARFAAAAGERHAVDVVIEPDAESFLLRAGTSAEYGARELDRVVERLVEAPFSGLQASGKLRERSRWRLVYDEGGVYWIPCAEGC